MSLPNVAEFPQKKSIKDSQNETLFSKQYTLTVCLLTAAAAAVGKPQASSIPILVFQILDSLLLAYENLFNDKLNVSYFQVEFLKNQIFIF